MKRNVVVPFLFFGTIAVILSFLFTYRIGSYLDTYVDERSKGQYLVNSNDILESTKTFLASKDSSELAAALRNSGYDLVLYDTQGHVLFTSQNDSNLTRSENTEDYSSHADINSILSAVDNGSRMLVIDMKEEGDDQSAIALIDTHQKRFNPAEIDSKVAMLIWSLCLAFMILTAGLFQFIYLRILRPFDQLQQFTGEIAKGNLDAALPQDRRNLFGAFTWAFDLMRSELKTSREREAEVEKTKKELVAALSHDIRTPVASVKACAECLKSLPDKNASRAEHYIDVILTKTDEITKLSGDMFMHAIMDVEKLDILPETYKSRELFNSIFEPLILQYENRIRITTAIPDVKISTDKQRLAQICENIIANCAKYSPDSDIHITTTIHDGMLKCCFRDFGKGVLPEDVPFLFDKFFRGKNARESGQPGSGLGLYISRYILERSGGEIKASNWNEDGTSGFQVELSLKISDQ